MKRLATAGALIGLVLASGCGAGSPVTGGGTVTVLAAASLTEVFDKLGATFERDHPGVRVTFSYGGSSTLAAQVVAGAPADVFASASPATMRVVTDAGQAAGAPVVFARNQLVIAVPPGNPRHVAGLADLARRGVKVALCAPEVPCGAAARTAFAAAGVTIHPVTEETDVKAALSKVELGEADAALVYRTDVAAAAGKVTGVEFAASASAVNDYPVVVLTDAPNRAGGAAFVDFVLSSAAARVLAAAGFQPPGSTAPGSNAPSPGGTVSAGAGSG